jgi:hypothetical protein
MYPMTIKHRLLLAAGLALAAQTAQAETPPPDPSNACNGRIIDAAVKRSHVPNKWTGSIAVTGAPVRPILVISVDGKHYAQRSDGSWAVEPWDPAKDERELRKASSERTVCEADGTDTIGGETADVLVQHFASGGDTGTIRTWISQSTGMTLRSEAEFSVRGAKTVLISNYDYHDVQAPPGVK